MSLVFDLPMQKVLARMTPRMRTTVMTEFEQRAAVATMLRERGDVAINEIHMLAQDLKNERAKSDKLRDAAGYRNQEVVTLKRDRDDARAKLHITAERMLHLEGAIRAAAKLSEEPLSP